MTLYHQESLQINVAGPGKALSSVWYFNDDGSIPDATGVYHEPLCPGYQKTLKISEEQDFIPCAVVEANNASGVYASDHAAWGFARFIRTGETDPVPQFSP